MRYTPSLSRRGVLLIAIISPALLGSEFKCVAVSNPSVATARIDQLEPTTPRVGDVMQATGTGNGAPPLQFAWDFGDGGTLAHGSHAAHVYTAPGSYRVTLTVRDAIGNTARDSAQVAVSARISPSVATLVLVSDTVAGQPVEFVATTFDADAGALNYDWTFSDGQSATGSQAAVIFPMAGVYLVSVTVTNDVGAIAVAQMTFEVVDAGIGP
jgi:PKD repeat protein